MCAIVVGVTDTCATFVELDIQGLLMTVVFSLLTRFSQLYLECYPKVNNSSSIAN